jgi:hypothetical protein
MLEESSLRSWFRKYAAWVFISLFVAQLGHLIEHISVRVQGHALIGEELNSELSHLLFNLMIAVGSVCLVALLRANPWTYPLAALAVLHLIEHTYIFAVFLQSGVPDGPGLFARGGVIGIMPLERLDLHNVYNGVEIVLMTLGLHLELNAAAQQEAIPCV